MFAQQLGSLFQKCAVWKLRVLNFKMPRCECLNAKRSPMGCVLK
jgi:hypothetical protein